MKKNNNNFKKRNGKIHKHNIKLIYKYMRYYIRNKNNKKDKNK